MNNEQNDGEEYSAYETDISVGMLELIDRNDRCVDADMLVLNRRLDEIIIKQDRMKAENDLLLLRIERIESRLNVIVRKQHIELTKLRSIEGLVTVIAQRLA
jgi:hypothetical protein